MRTPIQPLTLLVVAVAAWIQRDQQAAIVYLLEENRVLKARLRGRKLRFTDDERRRLAVKGKALGRKLLAEVAGIVTTYYVLIVIELSTRRVHVAGITPTPDSAFMMQVGRNLTDPFDGFLLAKRFLIMDRDKKFTEGFRRLLDDAGTRAIRLPPRSPNLNAYVERFILSGSYSWSALSALVHNYGHVPRTSRRPSGKARGVNNI